MPDYKNTPAYAVQSIGLKVIIDAYAIFLTINPNNSDFEAKFLSAIRAQAQTNIGMSLFRIYPYLEKKLKPFIQSFREALFADDFEKAKQELNEFVSNNTLTTFENTLFGIQESISPNSNIIVFNIEDIFNNLCLDKDVNFAWKKAFYEDMKSKASFKTLENEKTSFLTAIQLKEDIWDRNNLHVEFQKIFEDFQDNRIDPQYPHHNKNDFHSFKAAFEVPSLLEGILKEINIAIIDKKRGFILPFLMDSLIPFTLGTLKRKDAYRDSIIINELKKLFSHLFKLEQYDLLNGFFKNNPPAIAKSLANQLIAEILSMEHKNIDQAMDFINSLIDLDLVDPAYKVNIISDKKKTPVSLLTFLYLNMKSQKGFDVFSELLIRLDKNALMAEENDSNGFINKKYLSKKTALQQKAEQVFAEKKKEFNKTLDSIDGETYYPFICMDESTSLADKERISSDFLNYLIKEGENFTPDAQKELITQIENKFSEQTMMSAVIKFDMAKFMPLINKITDMFSLMQKDMPNYSVLNSIRVLLDTQAYLLSSRQEISKKEENPAKEVNPANAYHTLFAFSDASRDIMGNKIMKEEENTKVAEDENKPTMYEHFNNML